MALALVHATRKLPHYFQDHIAWVLTEYPLQSLLRRLNFTGRIAKWGTRLRMFDVCYKLRNSNKGQVLANFVAEFTPLLGSMGICQVKVGQWKAFVDGGSNAKRSRVEIILVSPEGIKLERLLRLGF